MSMKNLEFDQGNTRNIMLHNTMEHCYGQHDDVGLLKMGYCILPNGSS